MPNHKRKARGPSKVISVAILADKLLQDNPKKFANIKQVTGILSTYNPKPCVLTIDSLIIDRTYQREPNVALIAQIVHEFDVNAVVLPVVAERLWLSASSTSRYSVVEGQQRVISMYLKGIRDTLCIVVGVKSVREEMDLFERINKYRRAISAAVHHKHEVERKEPRALELENALIPSGFHIIRHGSKANITGVKKLHSIAEAYAASGLDYEYFVVEKGLLDVKASFPDCKVIPANVVAGYACFQHACKEIQGKHVSSTKLARYINPVYPNIAALKKSAKIRGATERKRGATDKMYAQLLFEVFNGQAPVGDRLPKSIFKHFE
jgi:hypothetical protein